MKYLLILLTTFLISCTISKTQVGGYKEEIGEEYQYSKVRQIFIFWGIVPLGRASAATPADGSCEVITKRNIGDVLISTLTAGIVTTYTIKVKDKRQE